MGGPLVDYNAKGVSSSLCLCQNTCEETVFEHSSCASSKDENFEAGIACGKDDLVVEEVGTCLAEVMHVYDHGDDSDEGTDLDENSDENDDSLLSLESDSTDELVDIDAEGVTSISTPSGNASKSSIGKSDGGNSSTNGTPTLVSAMKGSHAKRGIVTRLSVSWDPDVYDPPVTSESHTVKAHQRSSRKSHYKYKSSKSSSSSTSHGHSSNGNKKDKRHSRHSGSGNGSSSSNKKDSKPSYRSTNGGYSSRTETSAHLYPKVHSTSNRTGTSDHQYPDVYASSRNRIEASDQQYPNVYGGGSSRIVTSSVPQYSNLSPSGLAQSASLEEPIPVLKTREQIKHSSSCCKEQPSMLSRHFVSAKYKGMFSFWSQNQLAS